MNGPFCPWHRNPDGTVESVAMTRDDGGRYRCPRCAFVVSTGATSSGQHLSRLLANTPQEVPVQRDR